MLGDAPPRRRDNQCRQGADVQGAGAVTAGADNVDDIGPSIDVRGSFAHHFGQLSG